jgi:anti-anti-sigma factor
MEREGETVIMTPPQDLPSLDGQESRQWASDVLGALGGTPTKHVVVDLRRAGPFGAAALGLYLGLWKGVRDRDGRMALCNASRDDRVLLCATSLNCMWPVCPTREKALEAVEG